MYEELQAVLKINEELEYEIQGKNDMLEKHARDMDEYSAEVDKVNNDNDQLKSDLEAAQTDIQTSQDELKAAKDELKRLEDLEYKLRDTNSSKTHSENELNRYKSEHKALQDTIKELQGKVDLVLSESKTELKEKDGKIEHLLHEISDYKDHMAKTIDLRKLSHANDLKTMQNKLDQVESEKSQYFYELQASQKDLEKYEKDMQFNTDNYKKEIMESYDKLQQAMVESSTRKLLNYIL